MTAPTATTATTATTLFRDLDGDDVPRREARFMLRLPADLHETLAQLAQAEERSLNGEIVFLLRSLTQLAKADWGSDEFSRSVLMLRAALLPIMPPSRTNQDTSDLLREMHQALDDERGKPATSAGDQPGDQASAQPGDQAGV